LTPKCNNELTLDPKAAHKRSELMLLLQSNSKTDGTRDELDKAELIQDEAVSVPPLDGLTNMLQHVVALSFK
jgi:PI-3-kinase-related kinase SMG-1